MHTPNFCTSSCCHSIDSALSDHFFLKTTSSWKHLKPKFSPTFQDSKYVLLQLLSRHTSKSSSHQEVFEHFGLYCRSERANFTTLVTPILRDTSAYYIYHMSSVTGRRSRNFAQNSLAFQILWTLQHRRSFSHCQPTITPSGCLYKAWEPSRVPHASNKATSTNSSDALHQKLRQ